NRGVPRVSVPVLSNATEVTEPSCSITTADLTSTPWRPALAMAANKGGMVASTTAHGEATIMNVMALSSDGWTAAPRTSGMKNTASVAVTTAIEYNCSTFSMNSCALALL